MTARLQGHLAISAGAGAGKTRALVELALALLGGEALGEPCEPGSLVAITFTERAAAELEERLRGAVAERAVLAEGEEATRWRRRLHALERMTVGTIHAFAAALLREHPVEAGLDPEFEVLEEDGAEALRREACREAALAAAGGDEASRALLAAHGAAGRRGGLAAVLADLTRERASLGRAGPADPAPADPGAAERARGDLLAGAATILARRVEARTASGRRAVERLEAALGELAPADREGPLDLAAARRLSGLAEALRGWRAGKGEPPELEAARTALSGAAEALVSAMAGAAALAQTGALCRLVEAAEAGYALRKAARPALDFDDLLLRARDLLRRDQAVRAEVRERTRALLVDEYQDVNRVQQEIFDLVAGGEPPGPLLLAVGDLKQSIYRFRGADVTVFAGLLERLGGEPGGRVIRLAHNYRSAPAVLDLVNAVLERAAPGPGARLYEVGFGGADRLVPVREGGLAPACEVLADGGGGPAAERRAREARALAARIQALVSGRAGVTVTDRKGGEPRAPRYGEVAVLFRRLTQVGEYERALRAAGVPYRLARGGGFYQAPEVRDLGELLWSLCEPGDELAWAALLRSPACAVSDGTLLLLSRLGLGTLGRREPEEVAGAVRGGWGGAGAGLEAELVRLRRFLAEWRGLRPLLDRLPLPDLLGRAVERLDLEAAHLASPEGERRLRNLRKALTVARRFEDAGGGPRAFAARLRQMAERPPREPEAELEAGDAVALLSVHQAKGLEWPVVAVPDLGARPRGDARRAAWDGEGRLAAAFLDLAEERFEPGQALLRLREEERRASAAESLRLLYVALTRARDYLLLSGEGGERGGEGTWAARVGAAARARPEILRRIPAGEADTFAVGPRAAAPGPQGPAAIEPAAAPPLAGPAPLSAVRLAVTDLAEYARCPRRHAFAFRLGLPERSPSEGGAPVQDDPARATARGTLAHAMLAESDLAAPPLERRAQLAAAAARRGYDPSSPTVRRILADVSRFLDAAPGRRLSALTRSGALHREVPFLLRLDGAEGLPACYLSGALDALWEERGSVTVVDFKYSVGRPEERERYRLQLAAYALAAGRAFPGRRVRAQLQFLRGALAAADLTPSPAELDRLAAEAPRLALGAFRGEGEWRTPAELGRSEERCRAEGCGYLVRCFRARPADAPLARATPTPARAGAEVAAAARSLGPRAGLVGLGAQASPRPPLAAAAPAPARGAAPAPAGFTSAAGGGRKVL
ncbi:MAG TPA: UvrD-helicase domain-containing protein [Anaeromyxobacteraceae bacterium]|nr:UvrD-helicase domain-containing protein [Anaeromyxobacteraceae bacterium]